LSPIGLPERPARAAPAGRRAAEDNPIPRRYTAATITDEALTELYRELDYAHRQAETIRTDWSHMRARAERVVEGAGTQDEERGRQGVRSRRLLTPRQRAMFLWCATGMTREEAGQAYGLGAAQAGNIVRDAIKRLGGRTEAHAFAIALAAEVYDLDDLAAVEIPQQVRAAPGSSTEPIS
jgi:DNA-binding CsgD family transcriptional regulator